MCTNYKIAYVLGTVDWYINTYHYISNKKIYKLLKLTSYQDHLMNNL